MNLIDETTKILPYIIDMYHEIKQFITPIIDAAKIGIIEGISLIGIVIKEAWKIIFFRCIIIIVIVIIVIRLYKLLKKNNVI